LTGYPIKVEGDWRENLLRAIVSEVATLAYAKTKSGSAFLSSEQAWGYVVNMAQRLMLHWLGKAEELGIIDPLTIETSQAWLDDLHQFIHTGLSSVSKDFGPYKDSVH
jgi:hypothetical protein